MCINGYQSCICINGYHPVTGMIQAIHSSQHYKTGYKLGLYEHLGLERMFTFSFLKMQNHTHIYMYTHMRVCMYSPQINLFVKWWMFGHYIIFYLIFVQIFLIDLNLKKKKILIYFDYFLFHFNFFPYADVHLFKASTWDRESCFLKVWSIFRYVMKLLFVYGKESAAKHFSCGTCTCWVHKKCNGVTGRLRR